MRVLHFFKAKSRFGISNPHKLQEDVDIGVENGPDAVLTRDFLTKFSQCYINEYVFPEPEKVHPKQFNKILGERLNDFRRFINSHIKCGQTQVVIGGDHSVTLPSILAVKDRVGSLKNLGYIQFDSHGDMNLKASSPTGNFHGMYMRPLVARFDIRDVERSVSEKLPVGNIMYVGNLDLDKGEAELFAKKKIKNIDRGALLGGKRNVIKNFKNFISSFEYLHVSFDIDVLDKTEASATGIPSEHGLKLGDIGELLNVIGRHPNLSFDLTEVNPLKSGRNKTIQSAHKILIASLS